MGGSAAAVLCWEKGPGGAAVGLAVNAVPGRKPFVCEARKQGGFGDGNPMQLLTDFPSY